MFTGKRAIDVNANEAKVITPYKGEFMTKAAVHARYGVGVTGEYVLCKGSTPASQCFDARRTNAGVAQYANDPRGSGLQPNAAFGQPATAGPNQPVALRTVRKARAWSIPANTEILVSYGEGYWRHRGGGGGGGGGGAPGTSGRGRAFGGSSKRGRGRGSPGKQTAVKTVQR